MRLYAYAPAVLVALDVDLLPGVTVPWVWEEDEGHPTVSSFLASLVGARDDLQSGTGRRVEDLPAINNGDMCWERKEGVVAIHDHFSETCRHGNFVDSGYVIRVPAARMVSILNQAIEIVAHANDENKTVHPFDVMIPGTRSEASLANSRLVLRTPRY